MNSQLILFIGLTVAGVALAIAGNNWLMKAINPRASGVRLTLYILVVLIAGFLITSVVSYFILKLLVLQK